MLAFTLLLSPVLLDPRAACIWSLALHRNTSYLIAYKSCSQCVFASQETVAFGWLPFLRSCNLSLTHNESKGLYPVPLTIQITEFRACIFSKLCIPTKQMRRFKIGSSKQCRYLRNRCLKAWRRRCWHGAADAARPRSRSVNVIATAQLKPLILK